MEVTERGKRIHFRSVREDRSAGFHASYRPVGHAFQASPGTLDHFLAERYALFTVLRDGSVLRADIHHRPWPLQPAEG